MNDGDFTFYTIQHRKTHESPWLKPNEPLEPVDDKEWSNSSWDYFGGTAEPWHGTGNDFRPKYPKAHDETHDVWSKTGRHGWWTADYALKAIKRLRKGSEKGKFVSKDGYGKVHQACRYEFRVIKVHVTQETSVLTVDDLVEAA